MSERIVIGLGGNVGGSAAIVGRFVAVQRSLAYFGDVRPAPIYRTAPIGGVKQGPFLNTAFELAQLRARPIELLATLQELERLMGRDRAVEERWGPRTLDLDILVWGERVIELPNLTVPHPRLRERRFALAPLVDLVGEDFEIVGAGRAGELLARVADQPLEQVAELR